jgi:glycosyltransferase involved in cell wall biosynthesis
MNTVAPYYPIFLSVVLVVQNQAEALPRLLAQALNVVAPLVSDFEIIVVDNVSSDLSVQVLKKLSAQKEFPNLQIFTLAKEVDTDTASWVGLENALGDFITVINPAIDSISFLPNMLEYAVKGTDVVFAANSGKSKQSFFYRFSFSLYNILYQYFNGVHLAKEAPQYRILSKRVVNFILQHPIPSVVYRHLPATGGFEKINLTYQAEIEFFQSKKLWVSIERGLRLLISTTRGPLRLVTALSLFGAVSNLIYSIFVISVGLFKHNLAPGWVTLSLQQSGMFFLISLVLVVLSEYILQMSKLTNEGPPFHIAQEFKSAVMTRHHKLNIEEPLVQQKGKPDSAR